MHGETSNELPSGLSEEDQDKGKKLIYIFSLVKFTYLN
jgi:hypothetical protein